MGIRKHFREEFRTNKIGFDHEEASNFYLSCWQKNKSPVPLFCIRLFVFLGCVSILTASIVLTGNDMGWNDIGYWFIFLTHWGILLITVTSFLACVVSTRAVFGGPIDSTLGLPWYIKLYWLVFDATLTIALFITVFYFSLLADFAHLFAVDPVLDLFIHGINSALMGVLLLTSLHPSHILRAVYPLAVGLLYVVFSLIYFLAGGINPFGVRWIYPMLDWENPGPTTGMVVVSAVAILITHLIIVIVSVLRDVVSSKLVRRNTSVLLA